nr:FHA domain-containing protein [Deltaproteobacteria bacterium]
MAGAKVPLTFRIFKGDQLLREEKLSLSVIKLGKVPSAHLKLDDETVSRMHAIIEVNGPGDVSIIDLGSTKGTFVNGQKVNKAKLQSGDTIVVGETRIELAIGSGEEEDVATSVNLGAAPPAGDVMASTPRPVQPMAQTMQAPPPPAPRAPAPPPPPAQVPQQFAPAPAPSYSSAPPALRPPPGMGPTGPALYSTAAQPASGFAASMAGEADDMGGARAVEVAAMLGDSVVGVKHCMDPRSGKVTPVTYGFIAFAGAMLIMAAIAFWLAIDNAAYNKGRYDYETTVLKKPGFSVRPRTLPMAYDWMMLGGFFLGIGAATYALIRLRSEKKSPFFRIGTAPGVEFATEGAPAASFPLVAPHGDDFAFNFANGMEGEMVVNGQSTSLQELAAQGRTTISPIPTGAKIRVRAGKTTFLVSAVPQPRRHAMPLFAALESRVLAYFAGSLAVHMGFWLILEQMPVD